MAEAPAAEHPSGATAPAAVNRSGRWKPIKRAWRSIRREILIPFGVAVIAGWLSGQIVADGQRKIDDEQKARDAATAQQQIDHSLELENLRYVRTRATGDTTGAHLPFQGFDLRGQALSGLKLENSDLRDADLSNTDLSYADLASSVIQGTRLTGATVTGAVLKNVTGDVKTDLGGIKGVGFNADIAQLKSPNLKGAILPESFFREADLAGGNLEDAVFNPDAIRRVPIPPGEGFALAPAHFEAAALSGVHAAGSDFTEAQLPYANLEGADLRGAIFRDADLAFADLKGADLRGADLSEANMVQAYYDGTTKWSVGFTPPERRDSETIDGKQLSDYLSVLEKAIG